MEFSTFGRHIAIDTWGVDFDKLNNLEWLEEEMKKAALASGATILSIQSKKFEPQGVTILVMLSESHLSFHSYPEKGFAALDCYTCGIDVDPKIAINHMTEVLKPKKTYNALIIRGQGEFEIKNHNLL